MKFEEGLSHTCSHTHNIHATHACAHTHAHAYRPVYWCWVEVGRGWGPGNLRIVEYIAMERYYIYIYIYGCVCKCMCTCMCVWKFENCRIYYHGEVLYVYLHVRVYVGLCVRVCVCKNLKTVEYTAMERSCVYFYVGVYVGVCFMYVCVGSWVCVCL